MSNVILEVFDASLQKTQVWFNDLMSGVGVGRQDRRKPTWPCAPCSTRCAIG